MINKMNELITEPDWDTLIKFGLPLNIRQDANDIPGYDRVMQQIILAAKFLAETGHIPHNERYYDSFKALLLSLMIHYPVEFSRIENAAGIDLVKKFELNSISGRDIKLRNISLNLISRYYRDAGIKSIP